MPGSHLTALSAPELAQVDQRESLMRYVGSTPASRSARHRPEFSVILPTAQLWAKRRAPAAPAMNFRWDRPGSRRTTRALFLSAGRAGSTRQTVPGGCIGAISTEIDIDPSFARPLSRATALTKRWYGQGDLPALSRAGTPTSTDAPPLVKGLSPAVHDDARIVSI
jgi:hypothetical protein